MDFFFFKVIKGYLLIINNIYKLSIDFIKFMEEVVNLLNFVFKIKYLIYYKVIMFFGVSYFVKKINLSDRIC